MPGSTLVNELPNSAYYRRALGREPGSEMPLEPDLRSSRRLVKRESHQASKARGGEAPN